jgi:hypothetical protein
MTLRVAPTLTVLAALAVTPSLAHADEPPPFTDVQALTPPPAEAHPAVLAAPTLDAFSYVRPQEKYYLRGALEVGTVLVVGNVDYLQNTGARGGTVRAGDRRWDLRYDWQVFRTKLTGEDWHVDTNHFNTNYVSHPFAGTMYYTSARANRLSWFESYSYALVGSLGWEFFGELREEVSINDVIVTSSAGLAIGETMIQMSSFFYRSRKNLRNDVLAAFFSPAKALNDWVDGAEHARSTDVDAGGLTRDEWHRFELFGGGGVTKQPSGTYADQRFGLDMRLVNLPGYEGVADRHDFFDDGNAAQLHFETTRSQGEMSDIVFSTRVVPFGLYERKATRRADGSLHGDGLVLGMLATFEYSVHDFDRDRARPLDLIAILSPLGGTLEYSHQGGDFRARTRLDLSGDFAGITAYALEDYRTRHNRDDANLQTVLKQEGYYHGFGVSAAPSAEVGWRSFELGGRVALDTWRGLEGVDEQQSSITHEIPLSDRRIDMRVWAAARIPRTPFRFELMGRRRMRFGEVGEVRASQSESSLYATGGLVF